MVELFIIENGIYQINMQHELIRLSTFSEFASTSSVSLLRLAADGFRYIGPDDKLECVFCGLTFQNWDDEETIFRDHHSVSPSCNPLSDREGRQLTNPYQDQENETVAQGECHSATSDQSEILEMNTNSHEREVYSNCTLSNTYEQKYSSLERLGIHYNKPRFPHYAVVALRMATFRYWVLSQSPEMMSQAGFYYTGSEDLVRCFHCGGGLSNWEAEDDPWVEHAHWFPRCDFLIQCKGHNFVETVQAMVRQQRFAQEASAVASAKEEPSETPKGNDEGHLLDSVAAISLYDMGYSRSTVEVAIKSWEQHSTKKPSASDLMAEILDSEEKNTASPSSGQENKEICEKDRESVDEVSETKESDNDKEQSDVQEKNTHIAEQDEMQSIQEENRKLKDLTLCKICMENEINIVFLPCGHMASCSACAPAMRRCPLCRSNVRGTVRAYLS